MRLDFRKQRFHEICHGSRGHLVCKALVFESGNWTGDQLIGCVYGGMCGRDLGALLLRGDVEGEESICGEISCWG